MAILINFCFLYNMAKVEALSSIGTQVFNTVTAKADINKLAVLKDEFVSGNLLHFFKKGLHPIGEITAFLSKLTDEEKYIGFLPDKWRQKFIPSDIKDKTREIQHLFSQFARDSYTSSDTPIAEFQKQIEALQTGLEEILGDKCNIEYVGSGAFGKVFRIQCAKEDLALKIYHDSPPARLLNEHGKTKEIANAVALNHTLKSSRCARFYCGKVTENSEPDAFMLSQFVPDNGKPKIKETLRGWIYRRFCLNDRVKQGNIISGKITDFGGIVREYENYVQQDFAKKLYPLIRSGDSKAILRMKAKYANDKDFNCLWQSIENLINSPRNFIKLAFGFGENLIQFFIESF